MLCLDGDQTDKESRRIYTGFSEKVSTCTNNDAPPLITTVRFHYLNDERPYSALAHQGAEFFLPTSWTQSCSIQLWSELACSLLGKIWQHTEQKRHHLGVAIVTQAALGYSSLLSPQFLLDSVSITNMAKPPDRFRVTTIT